jgi:hypothetical protein
MIEYFDDIYNNDTIIKINLICDNEINNYNNVNIQINIDNIINNIININISIDNIKNNTNLIIYKKSNNYNLSIIKSLNLDFLFKLISYINDIDDNILLLILKYYIKHNIKIIYQYNLENIINLNKNNYHNTYIFLNKIYKLIYSKKKKLKKIKKFYNLYDNKIFWIKKLNEQIIYLKYLKYIFESIYDSSHDQIPFHLKLNKILIDNNSNNIHEVLKSCEERLLKLLNIFGPKLFQYFEIPLIRVSKFYKLSYKNIIKYLTVIYNIFNNFITNIILLFESYKNINNQINNEINN